MPLQRFSFLVLGGGALLLGACAIPDKTPSSLAPVTPQELGLGTTPAPAITEDWWKVFADPQVDRLVARMLDGNPTLQGAMARMRGAAAELAAADAMRLPQAALDGTVTFTRLSDEYVLPAPYGGSWRWVGDVQARMRWSLDFWGKQSALIGRA